MPRNWPKEFAAFRKAHDMTQRTFSLALGVCEKTVWSTEAGQRVPYYKTRVKLTELQKRHAKNGCEKCLPNH